MDSNRSRPNWTERRRSRSRSPEGERAGWGRDRNGGRDRYRDRSRWDDGGDRSGRNRGRTEEGEEEEFSRGGENVAHITRSDHPPIWTLSGLLAAESNNFRGVALKYHEPHDAQVPVKQDWRLFVFADEQAKVQNQTWYLSRQSAFLFGRDAQVTDVHVDHSSVSKQHAVLQFRKHEDRNEFGDRSLSIKSVVHSLFLYLYDK